MASTANARAAPAGLGADLLALARTEGSANHPWRSDPDLRTGPQSARNLADLVHHVALLHASAPGLVDMVDGAGLLHALHGPIVAGFAAERDYLAHLVVAVGPIPSTAGHALAQAAIVGQRHAIETLANSARSGCSCGAVAGLLLDWSAFRPMLDAAAVRFGIVPAAEALPPVELVVATIDAAEVTPAELRAIGFGARQLLLQHRGLWDLVEARAHARGSD